MLAADVPARVVSGWLLLHMGLRPRAPLAQSLRLLARLKALAYWGLAESDPVVHAMRHALELNSSLVDDADHYVAFFVVDAGLRQSLLADIRAIQDALIEA